MRNNLTPYIMKALTPIIGILLIAAAAFGGYQYGTNQAGQKSFDQGVQTGQLATIIQIVDQAIAAPCQTINLFNRTDEANPKEVDLINITCEGLNLPSLDEATEATE